MTLRRSFWYSAENLHHFVYFAPDAKARYEAIGLKGQWMGYFASRSAAVGTPSAELVVALFHGFAPRLVHRAIPSAWELADRDRILATRYEHARSVIGPAVEASGVDPSRAADVVLDAIPTFDLAVRPLAAAHAALPAPDDALGRLWHGATVLREYRGDAHLAVLSAHGLGGVDANVLDVAAGLTFPNQQQLRGWSDDDWAAGRARLHERGWLDADGAVTAAGGAARASIEDQTDATVAAGIPQETQDALASVADDLKVMSKSVVEHASSHAPH